MYANFGNPRVIFKLSFLLIVKPSGGLKVGTLYVEGHLTGYQHMGCDFSTFPTHKIGTSLIC